jgi:hypothetical protein
MRWCCNLQVLNTFMYYVLVSTWLRFLALISLIQLPHSPLPQSFGPLHQRLQIYPSSYLITKKVLSPQESTEWNIKSLWHDFLCYCSFLGVKDVEICVYFAKQIRGGNNYCNVFRKDQIGKICSSLVGQTKSDVRLYCRFCSTVVLYMGTWCGSIKSRKEGFCANVTGLLQFCSRWLLTIKIYLQQCKYIVTIKAKCKSKV